MQLQFWIGAGVALGIAILAGLAEHRRRKRRDLERVGWVPWMAIQMAGLFAALLLVSVALHLEQ